MRRVAHLGKHYKIGVASITHLHPNSTTVAAGVKLYGSVVFDHTAGLNSGHLTNSSISARVRRVGGCMFKMCDM